MRPWDSTMRRCSRRISCEWARRASRPGLISRAGWVFRRVFQEQVQTAVLGNTPAAKPVIPIAEGARVRLKGIREVGRVRRKLSDNRLEVEAGLMKLQVGLDDVEEVLPAEPESSRLPKH